VTFLVSLNQNFKTQTTNKLYKSLRKQDEPNHAMPEQTRWPFCAYLGLPAVSHKKIAESLAKMLNIGHINNNNNNNNKYPFSHDRLLIHALGGSSG